MQLCKKCNIEKELKLFNKNNRYKNGFSNICKECYNLYLKEYRKKTNCRKKYYYQNRKSSIEYSKEWYGENKERKKETDKKRYRNKYNEIRFEAKEYYKKNSIKIKIKNAIYRKNRFIVDQEFRVKLRLRHRLNEAFKRYSKNGKVSNSKDYDINYNDIFNYIGKCPGDLKDYHIDHIIPLCIFNFDNVDHIKIAFLPENHQWLEKNKNLKKHNSINNDTIKLLRYLEKITKIETKINICKEKK